jgi:membrane-bound lytic murein transglycosylase MltF
MSIVLQESGYQQGATGPNGEIGLMQITPDKCPSSGDCYDPDVSPLNVTIFRH